MLLAQIIYPTSFPGPYVAGKYRDFLCGSSFLAEMVIEKLFFANKERSMAIHAIVS